MHETQRRLKNLYSSKKKTFESSEDLVNLNSFIEKVKDYVDAGVKQQKAIKQMKNIVHEQTGKKCDDAVEKLALLIDKSIQEKFK